jgi:hypothetical protein
MIECTLNEYFWKVPIGPRRPQYELLHASMSGWASWKLELSSPYVESFHVNSQQTSAARGQTTHCCRHIVGL